MYLMEHPSDKGSQGTPVIGNITPLMQCWVNIWGISISVFTPLMSWAEVIKLEQIADNVNHVNRHQESKMYAKIYKAET